MRIAIATPTGHIGSTIVRTLLERHDLHLVLLARHAEKLRDAQARGATLALGELGDEAYLAAATQEVDALFWLIPPDPTVPDLHDYQRTLTRYAAGAIRENKIPRVVFLSSFGANLREGLGAISGLGQSEAILEETGAHITHLRPGFFYENAAWWTDGIVSARTIFSPLRPEVRQPMIATADIGVIAARELADSTWTGRRVIHLHGPRLLSAGEYATGIGAALGAPVGYVQVPLEAAGEAMRGMGISDGVIAMYLEMYAGVNRWENALAIADGPIETTPTTIEDFIAKSLVPALTARTGSA